MEITSGNNSEGDLSLVMPEKNIVNNRRQTFESYCVFASHFIAPVVGNEDMTICVGGLLFQVMFQRVMRRLLC